ncbi:MAG: hypothetical protein CL799_08395 [Chromatiales bacterium]|nr:hypothetical protein [Chromatiales bacterium]
MAITALFFFTMVTHLVVSLVNFRAGVFFFLFFYAVYPRFFSLGLGGDKFAMTGQRAMVIIIFLLCVLRFLWGSADIREAWLAIEKYKGILIALTGLLLAHLAGNIVTGRLDPGSISVGVSECLFSIFVVYLIILVVRKKQDVLILTGLLVLSLLLNQGIAIIEFSIDKSIFPTTLDLQYEQSRSEEDLLEGRVRADHFRSMGVFDSGNALGGLIIVILPFAFMSLQAFYSPFRVVLSAIVIMLAMPTAYFTGSRTALGFTLAIIAWYLYSFIARGLSKGGRRLLLAFFVFIGLGAALPFLGDIIETVLFGDTEGSTMARYLQYGYTFVALTESPFFGYGYAQNISEIVNIKPLDSYYMRIALGGGLVAIACLLYSMRKAYVLAGSFAARSTDKIVLAAAQAIRVMLVTFSISMAVQQMPQIRMYAFLTIGLAIAVSHFIVDATGEGEA